MDKKELRKSIKALVRQLSEEQKLRESEAVFGYIETTDFFKKSRNVMLFSSLPDELPTHNVIEHWPRVSGDDIEVIKYEPGTLKQGSFNIMEPATGEVVDPSILDLVIVPGVAFDHNCNRCGRGKGYYDRFLSQTHAVTIAVCFDCQLVSEPLPVEPHDIPAQHLVTSSIKII